MATTTDLQRGSSAEVIARQIRSDIEAGRYQHGQQLPSTRTLAAEWETSVNTINRAMAVLADEGIVTNRARSSRLVNFPSISKQRPHTQQTRPSVIFIGGYAGSGKTELGRIMARLTGWPMLDKDSLTRPVVEAALGKLGESPHDRESPMYLSTIRPAEYEALRMATSENVSCGNSVIVTAPFLKELADPTWSQRTIAEYEAMGADVRAIWVRCDPASMRTYLTRRGAARDSKKLAEWDDYLRGVNLEYTPALPHDVINNSLDSPPLREQAVANLSRWGASIQR